MDVYDRSSDIGIALLTDHTTSYTHGARFPLGLTLQYAGIGLWGREYTVRGPTEVRYSLLPHRGNYEQAHLWTAGNSWNEPLVACLSETIPRLANEFSLLRVDGPGWEVPTMRSVAGHVLIRLFNASWDEEPRTVHYGGSVSRLELVQLNGETIRGIPFHKNASKEATFKLALPRFGVRTLRITP